MTALPSAVSAQCQRYQRPHSHRQFPEFCEEPDYGLTANRLCRHHEVVEITLLRLRTAGVPVVLQEHRIDAIRLVTSEPVHPRALGLEVAVDAQLEHPIRQPRRVEFHVRFHAVPLADVGRIEDRRLTHGCAEPAQVREIVVADRLHRPSGIGPRSRIDHQIV